MIVNMVMDSCRTESNMIWGFEMLHQHNPRINKFAGPLPRACQITRNVFLISFCKQRARLWDHNEKKVPTA